MREGKSPLLAATAAIATAKASAAAPADSTSPNDYSTEQQGPVDLNNTVNSVSPTVPLVMPAQPARLAAEPESDLATLQREIMSQRQLAEQRKAKDYTRTCARIKRNLENTDPEIDLEALYDDILAADISSKVPPEPEVMPEREPESDTATEASDATDAENTDSAPAIGTATATDEAPKQSTQDQAPKEQPWQTVWDYRAPVVLSVTEHPEAYRPQKRHPLYLYTAL